MMAQKPKAFFNDGGGLKNDFPIFIVPIPFCMSEDIGPQIVMDRSQ